MKIHAGHEDPARTLDESARRARILAQKTSVAKTRALLKVAQKTLESRIDDALGRGNLEGSFTVAKLRISLHQVRYAIDHLAAGMKGQLLQTAEDAAGPAVKRMLEYMRKAQRKYVGIASQPLAFNEIVLVDAAKEGARTSVLRRISGDPEHPGQAGVLQRYGSAVIGRFEKHFQLAIATGASVDQVRESIRKESPFLKQAPAHWAERIARTETMAAHNAAALETIQTASVELEDMVKILCATFDSRTGSDSFAVHGQIRRPSEAFQSWFGSYMHPPNRPNDREVVVPHRLSWPLPASLRPRSAGEIAARWRAEGRKGSPPAQPKISTVGDIRPAKS